MELGGLRKKKGCFGRWLLSSVTWSLRGLRMLGTCVCFWGEDREGLRTRSSVQCTLPCGSLILWMRRF